MKKTDQKTLDWAFYILFMVALFQFILAWMVGDTLGFLAVVPVLALIIYRGHMNTQEDRQNPL